MMDLPDFPLAAQLPLSLLSCHLGFSNFHSLAAHVQTLPYGRNANRTDLRLVLSEGKGSCSSKHAFLKAVAVENRVSEVELILGIYRMHRGNTPGIGDVLEQENLQWIPEAHCYLKVSDKRIDLTQAGAAFDAIAKDLLEETLISPDQVAEYKVSYHQKYLWDWVAAALPDWQPEKVWGIRERCIARLSENTPEA